MPRVHPGERRTPSPVGRAGWASVRRKVPDLKVNDRTPDMEGGKIEATTRSYDFTEDVIPPGHCCCGKIPVESGCRVVACLCLVAIIANCVLYFMGVARLGFSAYTEVILLIFDFLTVFLLFCGLSRGRAGFLKPYMFFNTLWIIGLCLLMINCLWQVLKGGGLPRNIWNNVKELRGMSSRRHPREEDKTMAALFTALLVCALGILIVVDCCFMHVVYRTFQYMAYKEDKAKEAARRAPPVARV